MALIIILLLVFLIKPPRLKGDKRDTNHYQIGI